MKIRTQLLALLALPIVVLALTSAGPDDKKPAPAGAGSWTVDPVHSTVLFKIKHLGTSWAYGRFDDVTGSFTFDADKVENSKVEIAIKTSTIDTNNGQRDEHLRGPDFFDVKQFPSATFKSKSIAKKGDHAIAVTGDLAIHGTTKSVTIDMEHIGSSNHPMAGPRTGFYGSISIKRSDFGLNYGPDVLGEDVELTLSIEGTQAK
jgi:polyisoprenoid-binding protein YceI